MASKFSWPEEREGLFPLTQPPALDEYERAGEEVVDQQSRHRAGGEASDRPRRHRWKITDAGYERGQLRECTDHLDEEIASALLRRRVDRAVRVVAIQQPGREYRGRKGDRPRSDRALAEPMSEGGDDGGFDCEADGADRREAQESRQSRTMDDSERPHPEIVACRAVVTRERMASACRLPRARRASR